MNVLMAEPVDVPPEAFEPKPLFPTMEAAAAVVEEVRGWVKDQPTWTWRGHTHAKPDPDEAEEIRYVADFQLAAGVKCPCPCCTPRHEKFGQGFIAWFPKTGCIRLMGQHCFKRLNPDSHAAAEDEYKARMKHNGLVVFLTNNMGNRDAFRRAIEAAMPLALHLDELQDILGEKLHRTWKVRLWDHVQTGALGLPTFDADGRPDNGFRVYATITGSSLIDPARKSFAPRLRTALDLLDFKIPEDVNAASTEELGKCVAPFSRSERICRETFAAMDAARQFVSLMTTATIRECAKQPGAPVRLDIRRTGDELFVGKSEDSRSRVPLRPCINREPPQLPRLVL
jgi:hypothetical protein